MVSSAYRIRTTAAAAKVAADNEKDFRSSSDQFRQSLFTKVNSKSMKLLDGGGLGRTSSKKLNKEKEGVIDFDKSEDMD